MSYALGQPVPLTINTRDSTNALADVGTITLTVTRPDGTVDSYTGGQIAHPSIGVYQLDYIPGSAGLHAVRWVATGVNSSAPKVDSFYVEAVVAPPIVSLAEARQHLGFSLTTGDDQLANFLLTASQACEDYTGKVWRRTSLTAVLDGGRAGSWDRIRLRAPVISVTSVVQDGVTLDPAAYTLDGPRGLLYRYATRWSGITRQNITVAYVAGPSDGTVPSTIRQGVLEMVRHLWETQRGAAGVPGRGQDTDPVPGAGYSIPNRVRELWDPSRVLGFA